MSRILRSAVKYKVPFDPSRPVFPDILKVVVTGADFATKLTTLKSFKKDQVICEMKGNTIVDQK